MQNKEGKTIKISLDNNTLSTLPGIIEKLPEYHVAREFLEECLKLNTLGEALFSKDCPATEGYTSGSSICRVYCSSKTAEYFNSNPSVFTTEDEKELLEQITYRLSR